MMDSSLLLPPTGTPLTGIDFMKRLPCGPTEQTRRVSEKACFVLSDVVTTVVIGAEVASFQIALC